MILKGEKVIDALAGMPESESNELIKLRAKLFDSNGNPIMPDNEEAMQESIQEGYRFCNLMAKRNELWLAKLN